MGFDISSAVSYLEQQIGVKVCLDSAFLRTAVVAVQYLLESESGTGIRSLSGTSTLAPVFSINSKSCYTNPLYASLHELIPANASRYFVPSTFSIVHNFIISLDPSLSDAEGWQYQVIGSNNSEWSKSNTASSSNFVRRRLWFRFVCSHEYESVITEALATFADSCALNVFFRGKLDVLNKESNNWENKLIVAYKSGLKVVNDFSEEDEYQFPPVASLSGINAHGNCEMDIFSSNNSNYSIRIRFPRDHFVKNHFIFSWNLALISEKFQFDSFTFGPPFHSHCRDEVYTKGDLYKLSLEGSQWKLRYFELSALHLRYFRGVELRGMVDIPDSKVSIDDVDTRRLSMSFMGRKTSQPSIQDCVFSITTSTGFMFTLRAASIEQKNSWIAEIAEQINGWPLSVDRIPSNMPVFSLSETFDPSVYDDDTIILSSYSPSSNQKYYKYSFNSELFAKNNSQPKQIRKKEVVIEEESPRPTKVDVLKKTSPSIVNYYSHSSSDDEEKEENEAQRIALAHMKKTVVTPTKIEDMSNEENGKNGKISLRMKKKQRDSQGNDFVARFSESKITESKWSAYASSDEVSESGFSDDGNASEFYNMVISIMGVMFLMIILYSLLVYGF